MSRQLNKDLFEEQVSIQPFLSKKNESPELLVQDLVYQVKVLNRKVVELTNNQRATEQRIPKLENTVKDLFSKSQNNIKRLETAVKGSLQSFMNKFSRLSTKVTEKSLNDGKIQEIIDRHNMVLQQYELRLTKLQKVISEQEFKLMNYDATLKQLQKKHYL